MVSIMLPFIFYLFIFLLFCSVIAGCIWRGAGLWIVVHAKPGLGYTVAGTRPN